jgi:outer membrane usher protein FimD/PapC
MRVLLALLALLAFCAPARAGDLTVSVRDAAGRGNEISRPLTVAVAAGRSTGSGDFSARAAVR